MNRDKALKIWDIYTGNYSVWDAQNEWIEEHGSAYLAAEAIVKELTGNGIIDESDNPEEIIEALEYVLENE